MKEVAGAVVATSLVLVAVFVPVALFPGTTGILFRQFALTIAFSVSISAFNALTLTPALSAIFLGHHRERAQWAVFRWFNRAFDAGAAFYQGTVRRVAENRVPALLAFALVLGGAIFLYLRIPRGFIPEDDQGYLMVIVQTPQGASLAYTQEVCARVEESVSHIPEVTGAFTVVGFSFTGTPSTRPLVFLTLPASNNRKATDTTRPPR